MLSGISFSIGEAAALGTALLWAVSCQVHAVASKDLGATGLALTRMFYSIVIMGSIFLISGANAMFEPKVMLLLIVSALTGVAICDTAFYKATLIMGPRLSVLVQSMSSCITAVSAYILFKEALGWQGAFGLCIAVMGVFFVLAEGGNITAVPGKLLTKRDILQGSAYALFSAFMLSGSFLCLKEAMALGASSYWAGVVRIFFGLVFMFLFAASRGMLKDIFIRFKASPSARYLLLFGGLFGTSGIWLSAVAMGNAPAGVAATFIALEPLFIIPINAFWEKRKPSLRAVLGTAIAIAGVALILTR